MLCRIKRPTVDPELGETVSNFAIALLQKMNFNTQNVFFSPTSIAISLGMVLAGAGGDTREQLLDVLRCGENEASTHNSFASLIKAIRASDKSCEIYTANRLYSRKNCGVSRSYVTTLACKYRSRFKQVDFADPSVCNEINEWVAGVTKDRIMDLIPAGALSDLTLLLIVNAIYFKGKWLNIFDERSTRYDDFYVSASEKRELRMMLETSLKIFYLYTEDENCQAIQLPYRGDSLCMVIILPKRDVGLSHVVHHLNAQIYLELISSMQLTKVEVFVPKFRIEGSYSLPPQLAALGMVDMFSPAANLTRITTDPVNLSVSDVIHKAFVEVNEEGTEAAAATAVVIKPLKRALLREEPIVFKADHPFMFSIHHRRLGCPLFCGTFVGP